MAPLGFETPTLLSAQSLASAFTPALASIPPDVDLDAVLAGVADDHVSAPSRQVDGLRQVVAKAESDGIDLTIVVIDRNPAQEAMLRDLATEVGKHEGGTVLVLSPDWVGTYSTSISRVKLEAAEDPAKWHGGDSVASANLFLNELENYSLPWTAISSVLFICTLGTVGFLYWIKTRRAAHDAPGESVESADRI